MKEREKRDLDFITFTFTILFFIIYILWFFVLFIQKKKNAYALKLILFFLGNLNWIELKYLLEGKDKLKQINKKVRRECHLKHFIWKIELKIGNYNLSLIINYISKNWINCHQTQDSLHDRINFFCFDLVLVVDSHFIISTFFWKKKKETFKLYLIFFFFRK